MGMNRCVWAVLGFAAMSLGVSAQTLATGDSRTVTEPVFPPTCTALAAQQAITNGVPVSETTFDTTRIQTALTACPSGQAVELTTSGSNDAFLIAPLNIPSGVGLIVDGGVTVFASRNPADYQVSGAETCGSYGAAGNGCKNLFTFNNGGSNTGSGIYGYGVIDGRGGSTMLVGGVDSGISWWTNADTATTAGKSQDNFIFMKPNKSTNLVLYKITLRNSPMFHVVTSNVSGMTVWGVKIQAPFTAHNTDGIDPQGTNITITNSSISNGDDEIAVSASSASSNITISNMTTYSGHGISVGSYTQGGLTNMLVENINMAGEPTDGNENGIRLKSALDRGGLLQTLTYENICMRDIERPIYITPIYNSNSGTLYPSFQNIVFQNMHVLATTGSTKYYVSIAGYNANYITTATLNNVVFDQLNYYSPAFSYDTIALAGNVYPATLQAQTGTGVTYTGTATATATPSYSCSATSTIFPYVVGELYVSTTTATNLKTATIASTGSVTLNAMVQPAKSQVTYNGTVGNYTGATALTQPVNFLEGTTNVGTAVLSSNGTLAPLTLTGLTVGTHTYTAQYPGDTNYSALAFGSVTVTVLGATVATTTTLTAPTAGSYGGMTTLSATVDGAGGTPSGTVSFYNGTTLLGSPTLTSGTASASYLLTGGPHSLTAVYSGDNTFLASTSTTTTLVLSTAGSTTAVMASPTTVALNGTTALTATVTGVSGAAVPSGQVSFTDGTTSLGNATLNSSGVAMFTATMVNVGARTVSASYGGDGNYALSSGTTSETVSAIATSLTLGLSATTTYPGAVITLTGTLTPAVAGQTITFVSASGALGTGVTNNAGVATYALTAGSVGSYALTASYAAAGNYGASASAVQTLVVGNAVTVAATPNPITIAPGSSGTVTVAIAPVSGFTGTVTVSCTTAVSYVTCSPSSTTVTTSGSVMETIAVAATVGSLERTNGVVLALVGLIGLGLASRKRRLLGGLMMLLLLAGVVGMLGCGSSSPAASGPVAPSGSQVVTITTTAAGVVQTTTVTVNIP
jgi:polygalacturonase